VLSWAICADTCIGDPDVDQFAHKRPDLADFAGDFQFAFFEGQLDAGD
jgi:hypothetical protein